MVHQIFGPTGTRMRLYDERNHRLYINAMERVRFLEVADDLEPSIRAFCLTLLYTGCRLSEAVELSTTSIDPQSRLISFRTLKKRDQHHVREVPIPPSLAHTLTELRCSRIDESASTGCEPLPLWIHKGQPLNRLVGYRWIKLVMAKADIYGAQASPKGLRHGYGVHAIRSGVQLNMLCKWMGHASMATTAIYADAVGSEELEIADRMWGTS